MGIVTYPLNNVQYTAEDAELFHCTRTSGVWAENSLTPMADGTGTTVTIGKGVAWIQNEEFSGKVVAIKDDEIVDLGPTSTTLPRLDVVALRFDASLNKSELVVKKGTPAASPKLPEITRTGTVYELYIASVLRPVNVPTVSASNLTDLRLDETVCGLMADSVTRVNTAAIQAQVTALIAELNEVLQGVKDNSEFMLKTDWSENEVLLIERGGTGGKTALAGLTNLMSTTKVINIIGDTLEDNKTRHIPGIDAVIIDLRVRVNTQMQKDTWYTIARIPHGSQLIPNSAKALSATYTLAGDQQFAAFINTTGEIKIKPTKTTIEAPNFNLYVNGIYLL